MWAGAKDRKNQKKVKCDGPMDRRTDGPTKRVIDSRCTRLKNSFQVVYEHGCMKGIELKD